MPNCRVQVEKEETEKACSGEEIQEEHATEIKNHIETASS
jgi:hypothetical protein